MTFGFVENFWRKKTFFIGVWILKIPQKFDTKKKSKLNIKIKMK